MRIGIDIDGVLTNIEQFAVDYFSKYCLDHDIEYHVGQSRYDISETFGVGFETECGFWKEYLEFYATHEKARPFAAEMIRCLKNDGHEIYIITARMMILQKDAAGEHMRQTVRQWLADNKIPYDKLIFSKSRQEQKEAEIREHHIDLMIEDNPNNVRELSEMIPVICYHTSYNSDCIGERIFRCYSWSDIYKTVCSL